MGATISHVPETTRSARLRWATGSEMLRLVHAEPGITRAQAAERMSLSSGAATELVERLRGNHLLAEQPARRTGPGRPTTSLGASPQGPLVIVVDLGAEGWRIVLADLVGELIAVDRGSYGNQEPAEFLPGIATGVARAARRCAGRARIVVAVVAGTVMGTRLMQFSTRGWDETDLGVLTSRLPAHSQLRLLAGNDATLGGLAEARSGAARGAHVALHILVAVGVGGALLVNGEPMTGDRGASGEYGHLPFGDRSLRCPCGARGCWDLMVDGRAMARELGENPPADPIGYADALIADVADSPRCEPRRRQALEVTARALGDGIAGLVNLHDPETITIAGLAPRLRAAAPEAFADGYLGGLMAFHRREIPPVRDSLHGDDGPVHGAVDLGVDEMTTPAALARWEAQLARG